MITSYKYMGREHTRCRVSDTSGDSVKVREGEVIDVELGSHPELTDAYFTRNGFVKTEAPSTVQVPQDPEQSTQDQ